MRKQILSNLARHMIPSAGTIVVVALMLLAYRAWAMPTAMAPSASAFPGMINYQGHLTDPSGYPVNEDVDITFTLYDALTDGTTLWTETHAAVPVSAGLFHVMLGSVTPIPNTVWSADGVYLGVQIGSDPEMTPREPVGTVPYALHALRASGLSAADGDPADAVVVDGAGNVGIRTVSPEAELDVNGWVTMLGRKGIPGTVPADGQWHLIAEGLNGYNAFEVIAAWNSSTGAHAMTHAIAIRTYGPGGVDSAPESSGINATSTFYSSIGNNCRPELKWTGTVYNYSLALRSLCSGYPSTSITYYVTKLW